MKRFPFNTIYLFLMLFLLASGCKSTKTSPQELTKISNCQQKISSKHFKFIPIIASPSNFRSIPLTPDYYFYIDRNNIQVHLPFFGRSFTAPMNPTEGGYKFSSSDFEYETIGIQNGSTLLKISTKDLKSSIVMHLDINQTGYTSLVIQETNRDPITFYGHIEGV